jgi:hypothetical protein
LQGYLDLLGVFSDLFTCFGILCYDDRELLDQGADHDELNIELAFLGQEIGKGIELLGILDELKGNGIFPDDSLWCRIVGSKAFFFSIRYFSLGAYSMTASSQV